MKRPGIKKVVSNGRVYWYHRAAGRRILSEAGTDAFDREIDALDRLAGKAVEIDTLGALCRAYLQSPEFVGQLKPRTKIDYRKVLHVVEPLYVLPLTQVTQPFILELRDEIYKRRKRRMANYVVQVLSLIFSWGMPRGYVKLNPAIGIPKIRKAKGEKKGNRPWTVEEFFAVLDRAAGGIKIAVALGGYAGVSEQDAITLTDSNVKEMTVLQADKIEMIKVLDYTRQKTDIPVHQPMHLDLAQLLEGATPGPLVRTRFNRAYTQNGFQSSFFKLIRKLVKEKAVGEGLTFHGLRHFVATEIANQGGGSKAIMSVLGQKTIQMAEHYSEQYNRRKSAGEGQQLLGSALKRADKKKNAK